MNRYLKIIYGLLFLIFFSSNTYSQITKIKSNKIGSTNFKNDSAKLKLLVVKLLKWHENDKNYDFDVKTNNPKDTFYAGINWLAHKKRMVELEKTNFFTKDFLYTYQTIAIHLDKELRFNKIKYVVGYLPPYGNDANEWCNCQDYPSDSWNKLRISNIKINNNLATFKWDWGDNIFYSIKAKNEYGVWRIDGLERFAIRNFTW